MQESGAVILVEEDAVCFMQDAGCPRRWQNLQPTGSERARVCGTCGRTVHYCDSKQEARGHPEEAVALPLFAPATVSSVRLQAVRA